MAEYRCHYIEDGERQTVVVLEATNDSAMFLEAEGLLAASGFVEMEIGKVSASLVGSRLDHPRD
jgi:hypothetical protein